MLVLTATLSLFSMAVYHRFSVGLYGDLDELLLSRADGIDDAIDLFWERERLVSRSRVFESAAPVELPAVNFVKIARQWINQASIRPRLLNIIVRIYDVTGLHVVSTSASSGSALLPRRILNAVVAGQRHVENVRLAVDEGDEMEFRCWTIPVVKEGRVVYIVQVASPLEPIHSALIDLRLILFLFLPLTILLTGVAGAFLAKKSLSPVTDMIQTIRQITAQNMKMRLKLPDTRDEIRELAGTFNEMVGRLDASLSAQQQLIQDISHEFKTPLTIMRGQLEVTLKRLRSPGEYEAVLKSGIEEIDKLNRVVGDLIHLARFDNKEARLCMERFNVRELVSRTIAAFNALAEQKRITLRFTGDEDIVITADRDLIRRMLLNLLSNAFKFTSENGKITVGLRSRGGSVEITVSDTGCGIPERARERIFDRFYCVDQSHASHGLGLSIVKSIVQAHRGDIFAASRPGYGSTFRVVLPQGN
ncbi:MAG: HAMP domain-containing histidine kinase [Candidatus Omnitrophica bacterium]|nr:HAMP domain-containing histidine kinase [Candidatus Omnitrophota bacterium]